MSISPRVFFRVYFGFSREFMGYPPLYTYWVRKHLICAQLELFRMIKIYTELMCWDSVTGRSQHSILTMALPSSIESPVTKELASIHTYNVRPFRIGLEGNGSKIPVSSSRPFFFLLFKQTGCNSGAHWPTSHHFILYDNITNLSRPYSNSWEKINVWEWKRIRKKIHHIHENVCSIFWMLESFRQCIKSCLKNK